MKMAHTYRDVMAVVGTNPRGRKYWVGRCDDKPDNDWISLATGIDPDSVIAISEYRYEAKKVWLIYVDGKR